MTPAGCPHPDTWQDPAVCPTPCGLLHIRRGVCHAALQPLPLGDQVTADLLRAAADKLDRLTEAATNGPWHLDSHSELEKGCRCLSCWDKPWAYEVREIDGPDSPDGCFYNMHIGQDDATYIANMGPQIAPLIAQILRNSAFYLDHGDDQDRFETEIALATSLLKEVW